MSMVESTHISILVKKASILEVRECLFLSSKRRFLISIKDGNNCFLDLLITYLFENKSDVLP